MHTHAIISELQNAQKDAPEATRKILQRAVELIESMGSQLDSFKFLASQKYRRSSEKIAPGQLAMQFIAHLLGGSVDGDKRVPAPQEQARNEPKVPREKRKSNIRSLSVVVVDKRLEGEERACDCGAEKQAMGYDTRRQIIYQPAKLFVQEERLHKYACRQCAAGVVMAKATPKLIDKSLASSSLLAHLMVAKVVDSTPIERVGKQFARHGADVAPSTLYAWFGQAAAEIQCLQTRIRDELCASRLISLDDTPMPAKNLAHVNNIQRGRIWLYLGDLDRIAFCAFC